MRILWIQLLFAIQLYAQQQFNNTYLTRTTSSNIVGQGGIYNVMLNLRLSDYQNPQLIFAENGDNCMVVNEDDNNNKMSKCHLIFLVTTDTESDIPQPIYGGPFNLLKDGSVFFSNNDANILNSNITLQFQIRPKELKIMVYHIGVILGQNQILKHERGIALVGTFKVSLAETNPGYFSGVIRESILQQTQLAVSYTINCIGSYVGPNCDLQCNRSVSNANSALCKQRTTGFFSICQYTADQQATNCHPCPWGIGNGSYCKTADGGILEIAGAGLTGNSFRKATIVLGIITGMLLILLVIVTVYSCVMMKKKTHAEESEAPGYNYHSSLRTEGNANRPLLQASYTAQSPSVQSDSFQRLPTSAPRFTPSLDAVPAKSSLRKTNYVPPAHVGGGSSINDTLNSSFASSVPMPPSREADV